MPIQKTSFSHTFVGARASQPGLGSLTLIAPLDGGATVAANVVNKYRTAPAAVTDHAAGSLLAEGIAAALLNINLVRAGGFADGSPAAVGSRTFGTTTIGDDSGDAGAAPTGFDTLPAADLPIYEVTAVTIDGVAVSRIIYTAGDPLTESYDDTVNGEVHVNTDTGAWKVSRSTSGAGAGVIFTYTTAASTIDALLDQVLLQPAEVITFAGWRYNAQYFGMWKYLVEWASTNNLMVYAATEDDVDNTDTDFQGLVAALRSDSFQVLAAKLLEPTDDLTSAYAAQQARSPPHGSLKNQPAPKGIVHDDTLPYTRTQFGDDKDPNANTFHELGVNVITYDGGFVHSSDRAMTDYAAATDVLFGGTRRTLNATNALVDFEVLKVLTASPTSALYDEPGLAALKGAIETGLNKAQTNRWIAKVSDDLPAFELGFPELADTEEEDRKERSLSGVFYRLRINGVVHTVFFTVEAAQ